MTADAFRHQGLWVRERRPAGSPRGVVLFVHGATVGSVLFDLPLPGYSLLEACAGAGWWSFACDLRGYARSWRPLGMSLPGPAAPLVCSGEEAVHDAAAVLAEVRRRTGCDRPVLTGGSWGSITAARLAAARPRELGGLVLLAPLFADINPDWLSALSDRADPARLNPSLGGWRYVTLPDLLLRWDAEIEGDPAERRDARMPAAMFEAEQAADPDCDRAEAFRAPNGTLHDLFEVFSGRPVYDPAAIQVPTVLLRGEHDGTATASDLERLHARLGARRKERLTIRGGGHFMQAERCAPRLQRVLQEALDWLPA